MKQRFLFYLLTLFYISINFKNFIKNPQNEIIFFHGCILKIYILKDSWTLQNCCNSYKNIT